MTRVLLQPLNLAYKASKYNLSHRTSLQETRNPRSHCIRIKHLHGYKHTISPDHVPGYQDSSRDMKKTKPIILAPKKHISSISYMRAMSVCAPCRYARNATKTKKRKNQAKVEIYCSCIVPKYVQYAFWGEASSILLLHRHALHYLGRFFHAAKKMLALKNPHITYPEGQLGKFR